MYYIPNVNTTSGIPMDIKRKEITVRELTTGYSNDDLEGVVAFDGKTDVRPKYQREYVYKDKERNEVIKTITKNHPLGEMYWAVNDNGTFEVLDGQQRTISICEYVAGNFSLNNVHFHNLEPVEQEQILDYELTVQFCKGNSKEKLEYFKTINVPGVKLSEQELRNAAYSGEWLSDAKRHFSKPNCPAQNIAKQYLRGNSIRQDFLQTALKWKGVGDIEGYMSIHQHDQNANELWLYFKNVIEWVDLTFVHYRKEMKGVNFGELFDTFKDTLLDTDKLEKEISELMRDDSVTKKSGIYTYVLTREEKYLNIRTFTDNQKREAYEEQEGVCVTCGDHFEIEEMEGDHITPWSQGGQTVAENCQMLCVTCNRTKSDK